MLNGSLGSLYNIVNQISQLDIRFILPPVLLLGALIILDSITMIIGEKSKRVGFKSDINTVGVDGVRNLPVRSYVSDMQGLAGRPDALINEDGFIIPIERKPLAKKIHDRYVAQLLVYMRLVEEFEGKRPPYGYLILGPNCRRFRIDNTDEKQAWLQSILDEMRAILNGSEAVAMPHPKKCAHCQVKDACTHKILESPGRLSGPKHKNYPRQIT